MKKINIFSLVLSILFLGALSVSAQNSFVSSVSSEDASYITIADKDTARNFLAAGGSQALDVETNLNLLAKANDSWCKAIVPENGTQITIEVDANTGDDQRKTEVIIYGKDNKSQVVKVIQLGTKPAILVNEKFIDVNQYASKFTLGISSNVAFTLELPSWVKGPSPAATIGFNNYEFTLDPITEENTKREADIVIKPADSNVDEIRIPVTQSHVGYPRFAVLSDIHFGNSQGEGPSVKVPKALKNLVAKDLDVMFICGDLTDWGTEAQWQQFEKVLFDNTIIPADLPVYYLMGNHDHYDSAGKVCEERYMKYTRQPLHQYIEIKGYPFITLSMNGTSWSSYSDECIQFLKASLEDAAVKYPGKPIFVMTHVPPKGTVYGSNSNDGNWGTDKYEAVLKNYPQVIIFAGHSHYPLGDPRSIYQNNYTSINDGSTTYSEIESGAVNAGIHPENYANVTEGLIVNVDKDMNVELERWDTYRNEEIAPRWFVDAPHDGSVYKYKGRTGGEAPVFGTNVKPIVSDVTEQACKITFAQATDDEVVHHYIIEILNDTKVIKTFKKFSEFYLNSDMPDPMSVTMTGLPVGTALTARVTAVDSYNKKSTPIVSEVFNTKGAAAEWVLPKNFPADKLVGHWEFNNSGTPGEATKGKNATLHGSAKYESVDGVGTVRIEQDASGSYQNYVSVEHGLASDESSNKYVRNYCLVMDAKLDLDKSYTALYRFGSAGDSDIFARGTGAGSPAVFGSVGLNGGGLGYSPELVQTGWNRIVVNAKLDAGTASTIVIYVCYPNGEIKKYDKTGAISSPDRFSIVVANPIMLSGDDDKENGNLNIAQVALFNAFLSDAEINDILVPWTEK
ncbi:MAG: metallophosphoesterase [Bacteroidales bacterium]|nr:metallophosphoesterase [Bacteroidales bacterium]